MASEYFHSGSTYSTDPKYNSVFAKGNVYGTSFKGMNSNFSELSSATDPRGANQLKELSETLNTGIRNIEVGSIQPNVFEAIPEQHFKEMNTMAKLAGAEVSFHAPMIDPTGISQQGWDKLAQNAAEKQLWDAIKKSHTLNPKNQVVTFHASSTPLPGAEVRYKDEGQKEDRPVSMIFINESDGKISQIKEEERYFGSKDGKPIKFNPTEELNRINEEQWMGKMSNVNFSAQRADSVIREASNVMDKISVYNEKFKNISEKEKKELEGEAGDFIRNITEKNTIAERELNHGKLFLREAYRGTKELFDDVYKKATPEEKEKLLKYSKEVSPFIEKWENLKNPEELKKFANVIEEGLKVMGDMKPVIFKPIKEFAVEKAAETTSNLALKSYNEFGNNAPIIALENHPAQQALLTTGDDLRAVVEKAHKLFVEKAVKEGTMSKSEAETQAKKLIGVTWDVGHINMMRKYGYSEKDLLKQTEAVAPFVKKVHLADNFGFEHTELPMGMGNVPIKAMTAIMEKAQKGEEGYKDIKKVIEAGDWWQHFSANSKANGPLMPTLAGMGSYVTGNIGWNQMYGTPGAYFSGYGTMLPENNFQTYGAGFMSLPMELGGQMPQGKDRFSGTPMA